MAARRTAGWFRGVAGSIAAHLILLAVALWSVRTAGPPPEGKAVVVLLVRAPALQLLRPPRPVLPQPRPAVGRPPAQAAVNPPRAGAPAEQAVVADAGPKGPGPAAPGGAPGLGGGVRAAVRAAIGCAPSRTLQLTAEERARCAETLGKGVDPNVAWAAPIAPEKREWFDAVKEARRLPGRPAYLGCGFRFGQGKITADKPAHGLKLGPLPCYIVPGRGALTEEVDITPPSRQQPHQDAFPAQPPTEGGTAPERPE